MNITPEIKAKLLNPRAKFSRHEIESLGLTWPLEKRWKTKLIKKLGFRAEYNRELIADKERAKAAKKERKRKRKLNKSVNENREYQAKGLGLAVVPFRAKGTKFYQSWEWKKARFETIKRYGAVCMCCGHSGSKIVVDHVKPRSKFPEFELDLENLQVLCNDCNMGKSNDDYTDFRPKVSADVS